MMQLAEWHHPQWHQLMDALKHSRLPHALLLAGPEGVGKFDFAKQLAARLLCNSPKNDLPCGACKGCHLIQAGSHPDWIQVAREEDSKFIKVDQIRDLVEFASKTAQMSGFKVITLHQADMMNISSSNALLKTLEEPSADTLIILVSGRPSSLSATVRSRCQSIRFPIPTNEQALGWLRLHSQESDATLEDLLCVAGGAPYRAIDLLKQNGLSVRRDWMRKLVQIKLGRENPLTVAELATASFKEDLSRCLREWLNWSQAWMKALAAPETADQDARDSIEPIRGSLSGNALCLWHDRLLERIKLLGSNPNPLLLFEELLLFWAQLQ